MNASTFEILLTAPPGLESVLRDEAAALGLKRLRIVPGGVETRASWPQIWRVNLMTRIASRVLVRVGGFPASHMAQIEGNAGKLAWRAFLAPGAPVKVEVSCRHSQIYHEGAVRERLERVLVQRVGATLSDEEPLRVMARIERNYCTISLDASGEPLHRRGFKQAVAKAPLRETLAAAFLRQCGYEGAEPVLDPMCGSGTFILEAAEIALGLAPGRERDFAFQRFTSFDVEAWDALKTVSAPHPTELRFHGHDRDAGAVSMSAANAGRAGLDGVATFHHGAVSALERPAGPPGLVMVNPPYGARIGDANALRPLYGALGKTLRERFGGWRVGMVTSEAKLAHATGLKFIETGPPIPHGPLKIRLYRTGALR